MNLHHPTADVCVPDGAAAGDAFARTTHLGIGAHQDDIEFMAAHGILACFGQEPPHFGAITCTNGAGSARVGPYAGVPNDAMCRLRRAEQRAAAVVGQYSFVAQLDFTSAEVKTPGSPHLVADLITLLQATRPQVIYTHNLADKHDTHVGVVLAVIAACRQLPRAQRPATVYGCEVWRDLDWLPDRRKVVLNVSGRENLAAALSGVFDSQISGGKRYDVAVLGRRRAHATFFESHGVDEAQMLTFAMDLTPLVLDPRLSISGYVESLIDELKAEVKGKLSAWK